MHPALSVILRALLISPSTLEAEWARMPLEWKFVVHSWIFEVHSNNSDCILSAFQIFGPIFLLLGGKPPKCTEKKKLYVIYMHERASASEIHVFSDIRSAGEQQSGAKQPGPGGPYSTVVGLTLTKMPDFGSIYIPYREHSGDTRDIRVTF